MSKEKERFGMEWELLYKTKITLFLFECNHILHIHYTRKRDRL